MQGGNGYSTLHLSIVNGDNEDDDEIFSDENRSETCSDQDDDEASISDEVLEREMAVRLLRSRQRCWRRPHYVLLCMAICALIASMMFYFLSPAPPSLLDNSRLSERVGSLSSFLPHNDYARLSVAMSNNGQVVALASPDWGRRGNALVLLRKQPKGEDSWQVVFDYNQMVRRSSISNRFTTVAQVFLSGNGRTLAVGIPYKKNWNRVKRAEVFLATSTIDTTWEVSPNLPLAYRYDSPHMQATDLSFNDEGTRFAVSYGSTRTDTASYDFGDESWVWNDYRDAQTNVYEWQGDNWKSDPARFDSNYQSDNFGYKVQMNSLGDRILQSSEHDLHQHTSNLIYHDDRSDAWYEVVDFLVLNPNDECLQQSSDVGLSSDGKIAVVSVQCLQEEGQVIHKVHTFVDAGTLRKKWQMLDSIVRSVNGTDKGPHSIALSGDGNTLILAVDGHFLEGFHRNETAWETVRHWQGTTSFSIAVDRSGSQAVIGTYHAETGSSLELWQIL